jgi:hypothetical protein
MKNNCFRILSTRCRLMLSLLIASTFLAGSVFAQDKKQVIFKNSPSVPVNLYWVNNEGNDQKYGEIPNGESLPQLTFEEARWVLKDKGGEPLGDYPVTAKAKQTFTLKKPTGIVLGKKVTLAGKIEQIKTYDDDGKAVFPFYLTTDSRILVKPAVDFDPGDTNQVL